MPVTPQRVWVPAAGFAQLRRNSISKPDQFFRAIKRSGGAKFLLFVACCTASFTQLWAQGGPVRILPKPTNQILSGAGTKQQYIAYKVFFTNGSPSTAPFTNPITWSSSDETVVMIDAATGMATTVGAGTAKIIARSGPFHGSTYVKVSATALSSISVSVPQPSLPVGESEQLSATGTFVGGGTQDITDFVTWSSSDPATIAVTNQFYEGQAQPRFHAPTVQTSAPFGVGGPNILTHSQGEAIALKNSNGNPITITATASGKSGTGGITGLPPVIVAITVTPAPVSLPVGQTLQFDAMATFSDGHTQDVTNAVTWASSDTSKASITAAGLASGIAYGPTTISATAGDGAVGSAQLTVTTSGGVAYVVNAGADAVTAYNIDYATGALTPLVNNSLALSSVATGHLPAGIALTAAGEFAYVVNAGDSTVSMYKVNPSGTLAPLGTIATAPLPVGIALDSSGSFAYVSCENSFAPVAGTVTEYSIDGSGMLHKIGTAATGPNPGRLAIPPTGASLGQFVYAPNSNGNSISGFEIAQSGTSTGTLSSIVGSPFATGNKPASATTDPSGRFVFVGNNRDATVAGYSIVPPLTASLNPGAGALTAQGAAVSTGTTRPVALAADPAGRYLYSADTTNPSGGVGTIAAFSIQPDGSVTADGAPLNAGNDPFAVAVDPADKFAYIVNANSNNISEFLIDPATGVLTASGLGPFITLQTPSDIAIRAPFAKALISAGITPANATVNPGANLPYSVTGNYSDGTSQIITSRSVFSITAGPTGGVVFQQNVAQALQAGSYTVTAADGTTSATTNLTVNAAPAITSISVTPASASVFINGTIKFTATANLSAGGHQDVTSIANWSSSNPGVATIASQNANPAVNGVASGKAPGTAQITASLGAVTSPPATLTVQSAFPITEIFVAPANYFNPSSDPATSIVIGGKEVLVATAVFSNGSSGPVPVNWSSSNSGEAGIDSTGLVTGAAVTPANTPVVITATSTTSPSIKGSAKLSVVPGPHALYSGNGIGTIFYYFLPLNIANIADVTDRGIPEFFALDRAGQFLYSLDDAGTISVFSGSSASGGTSFPVTGFSLGNTPSSIAVDRQDRFLFAAFNGGPGTGIAPYRINLGSGNFLVPAAVTSANADSMAVDPSGAFLYVASGGSLDTYSIDQSTGALTLSSSDASISAGQILLDRAGTLAFVFGGGGVNVYNVSGGTLTLASATPGVGGTDVALDPESPPRFLYTININTNQIAAYTVGANGALTALATASTDPLPLRVAADPDGQMVYVIDVEGFNVAGKVSAYQIHPGSAPFFTQIPGSPFPDDVNPRCIAVSGP